MNNLVNKVLLLTILMFSGCGRDLPRSEAPQPRTVSFSPAVTEMLFEMGLGDHIVGVTTFCKPPGKLDIPIVGNDLNITVEPILAVSPDVLITQSNPRRFETLARLSPKIRIEYVRIETFGDIADAMARIATLMGDPAKGNTARSEFLDRLDAVRRRVAGRPQPRVIFVMGHHDPSTAGKGTFINELIEVAGGVNIAAEKYNGWKKIGLESLLKLAPDVIVCESEALVAEEARQYWSKLTAGSPNKVRVHVVTDRRCTIPTGRMADTFAPMMADFLHPETVRGGS
ncbi:MAG: helical backbone metal receptor [Phycisphaerae bacterium]|jgi:iron complex transport system substrate-binding protein|nr:helical backbone metal receptor [Phycisphaerae bacterium]